MISSMTASISGIVYFVVIQIELSRLHSVLANIPSFNHPPDDHWIVQAATRVEAQR